MTEKSSTSTAVIALVAIAVVVALAAGLGGTTKEVREHETYDFVAAEHAVSEGVVFDKVQRGGFDLFGFAVRPPDNFVEVIFTVPESCEIGSAAEWPIDGIGCVGPADVVGPITGSGLSPGGNPIVMVEVTISVACFDGIDLGMVWPAPSAGCRAET